MGLTLLAHAHLPSKFWDYAFDTAVYLINRLPTRSLGFSSPFEKLHGKLPDYHFLRVFGCLCFPYLRPYTKHKLEFRSRPCVFLGYPPSQLGYRCFDPKSNRIFVVRTVVFDEQSFPFRPTGSLVAVQQVSNFSESSCPSSPGLPISVQSSDSSGSSPSIPMPSSTFVTDSLSPPEPASPLAVLAENVSPIAMSTDQPVPTAQAVPPVQPVYAPQLVPASQSVPAAPAPPTSRPHHMVTRSRDGSLPPRRFDLSKHPVAFSVSIGLQEPTSFAKAKRDPRWVEAMQDEFQALLSNRTWDLVPPPSNQHIISCKWVYRVKQKANGSIDRFKARLVAKGFNQQEGIDYEETFSPVIKSVTIRTVLSIAISLQWPIRQLDVKNAFLHGHLDKEVYMQQPPSFVDSTRAHFVCRLNRSLYGFKQAPRAWFLRLSEFLLRLGFKGSRADSSLFILRTTSYCAFLLVYVDDIILTGTPNAPFSSILSSLN
ncbi:hypothetical protein CRG98_000864 [Punica granatum]|uniref:Uncharacterized protein n=1 Tax=Punica granatum TaxID=22663 RepID=A0A2I0LDP2_PUNGR|nr:hypothetical protein CRG98_000864 [Punica granatum]